MISNIVVAVDDSPGGLAAAGVAIELAQRLPASLHAIAVVADGVVADVLSHGANGLRPATAANVLGHVNALAKRAGLPVELSQAEGEVATTVLRHAADCAADLVVIGRSRAADASTEPYVGSQTRLVLEFATAGVLVVAPAPAGRTT